MALIRPRASAGHAVTCDGASFKTETPYLLPKDGNSPINLCRACRSANANKPEADPKTIKAETVLIPMLAAPDSDVGRAPEPAYWTPSDAVTVKVEEALVKPEGSAWINSETLEETSFRWQEVVETDAGGQL
jgi:hypothetical protein